MTTALYAGLSGILLLALSSRVVNARRTHSIGIGDGGNDELMRAIRVQANFTEYVPLILVLILLIEMNGNSAAVIHSLGAGLIISRVLHAAGLSRSSGVTSARFVGVLGTWLVLAISSAILLMDAMPR
ncbi:MAG TPA: glutathione S-transferase [Spongiibacteraceae bacterium]|nr:glutathione S-transferase [Spongiibacteraceae bacterium]HCS29258.1 glutathione S-transferase [Spongiibacteraceae bacterium]|tara:strand:- start:293 stop:676 length:384 start_codon:yes stop_codon:yes gene_type:complete